jgi:hypothetical protein
MADGVTVGSLLGRAAQAVGANLGPALAALGGLTALATLLDQQPSVGATNIATAIASLFAQFLVTRRVLETAGLLRDDDPKLRVGQLFGLNLLTGLGIALGFVLLIVPGIWLAARWALVGPILVGEADAVSGKIGASWERTRGHALPIALALVVAYLPVIAAIALIAAQAISGGTDPAEGVVASLVLNLAIYASTVFGWHVAIAAYAQTLPPEGRLAEVFA